MKINIKSIHNHGNAKEEYAILDVTQKCDIGKYLLADTTYTTDGNVSSKLRHLYWLPNKEVEKGDTVYIYTGEGKNSTSKNSSGQTIHKFYWQLKVAVWNDDKDCACLIEANTWQFKGIKSA